MTLIDAYLLHIVVNLSLCSVRGFSQLQNCEADKYFTDTVELYRWTFVLPLTWSRNVNRFMYFDISILRLFLIVMASEELRPSQYTDVCIVLLCIC